MVGRLVLSFTVYDMVFTVIDNDNDYYYCYYYYGGRRDTETRGVRQGGTVLNI